MGDPQVASWAVVVPVKLLTLAKTRLSAYGDEGRAALALAFAADAVAAALRCSAVREVLVVTDDVTAADALAGPRTRVVPDAPDGGLNPALVRGAALLRAQDPAVGVVALTSDLPALRPDDLADALAAVGARAFVADADGVGTTLLAAAAGHDLRPAYGPDSRRRHLDSGAEELPAPDALRRDVDTPADLRAALRLGVGPATRAALDRLERAGTVGAHGADGGWVVLDDGSRRTYAAGAVAPEVRLLHPGQRVRLVVDGAEVRVVTLAGLPLPG